MPLATSRALEVVHSSDPKDMLWKAAAPLVEHISVFGDDALIAIYSRGEGNDYGEAKTVKGIIIPGSVTAEDDFQGKVGLLMKVGPLFYCKGEGQESNSAFFGNSAPKVGEWVMFRVGDTYSFKVKKHTFRMCEARMLRAGVTKPDVIW